MYRTSDQIHGIHPDRLGEKILAQIFANLLETAGKPKHALVQTLKATAEKEKKKPKKGESG